LLTPAIAAAQPNPAPAAPAPAAAPAAAPQDADLMPAEAPKAAADGKSGDDAQKQLDEMQKSIDDLQAKVDAASATEGSWADKFRLYGFTDVGLNRLWINKDSKAASVLNSSNATSFVIGNLNVYFDAQPIKGWRSLVEVRFTNAPQGEVQNFGGVAGTFKRTQVRQFDPHSASTGMQMWGGYTVIERAHIDWTDISWFKVRVGNFFTPFGIWNVDHGSPTLIATQMPEYIVLRMMPLRQTGIQAFGNTFKGDWELGYAATVTNGRQELSNFAFDDNRGFGGRLYANNEKGDVSMKYGASFYTGRTHDQEIDVTSISPVTIAQKTTFNYREVVGGLDASLDIGRTRIRLEGVMSHVQYDAGKHEAVDQAPGLFKPNEIGASGYALVAHQLPWVPVEPYAMFGALHSSALGLGGDLILNPSLGVNIRFNKSVMLKTQASRTLFTDLRGHGDQHETAKNNITQLYSRLVLVF
jgi:hypothetical protein